MSPRGTPVTQVTPRKPKSYPIKFQVKSSRFCTEPKTSLRVTLKLPLHATQYNYFFHTSLLKDKPRVGDGDGEGEDTTGPSDTKIVVRKEENSKSCLG